MGLVDTWPDTCFLLVDDVAAFFNHEKSVPGNEENQVKALSMLKELAATKQLAIVVTKHAIFGKDPIVI